MLGAFGIDREKINHKVREAASRQVIATLPAQWREMAANQQRAGDVIGRSAALTFEACAKMLEACLS
jgi:hypothetical protein